jgi:hypothetical protein
MDFCNVQPGIDVQGNANFEDLTEGLCARLAFVLSRLVGQVNDLALEVFQDLLPFVIEYMCQDKRYETHLKCPVNSFVPIKKMPN